MRRTTTRIRTSPLTAWLMPPGKSVSSSDVRRLAWHAREVGVPQQNWGEHGNRRRQFPNRRGRANEFARLQGGPPSAPAAERDSRLQGFAAEGSPPACDRPRYEGLAARRQISQHPGLRPSGCGDPVKDPFKNEAFAFRDAACALEPDRRACLAITPPSRGPDRHRRAYRAGSRVFATRDESPGASIPSPIADRFRRPRRAGSAASRRDRR